MHIQVITYSLKDIGKSDYEALCMSLAPIIAAQPGLIEKVWLADPATNTYGGMYKWQDREAMEAFMKSEVVHGFASHPAIVNLASRDFPVWADASRVTRGLVGVPA